MCDETVEQSEDHVSFNGLLARRVRGCSLSIRRSRPAVHYQRVGIPRSKASENSRSLPRDDNAPNFLRVELFVRRQCRCSFLAVFSSAVLHSESALFIAWT